MLFVLANAIATIENPQYVYMVTARHTAQKQDYIVYIQLYKVSFKIVLVN